MTETNGHSAVAVGDPRFTRASFLTDALNGNKDPADAIPGMAANFGRDIVPHILTFQSLIGSYAKVYRDCDEATKASLENARYMRNDCGVMECVESRQRCVSLLGWHLQPEDEKSQSQKDLCDELTKMLNRMRSFTEWRYSLMHAIWYGKYGVNNRYGWQNVGGHMRQLPTPINEDDYGWKPINGDKLVFRYDDGHLRSGEYPNQLGIRVNGSYRPGQVVGGRYKIEDYAGNRVQPTDRSMAYFLPPYERKLITIHKHIIEDAAFEDALSAGSVNGIGIRSRIYWEWVQKQETLAFLMEYLERSAGGVEVWTYPQGNDAAKQATEAAARERLGGARNVVIVPKPMGVEGEQYGVQIIEPGMAGIDTLKDILNTYYGHRIKRYILGQTLTSEAESTGLGSGVADAHMDTFMQIVRFDALKLEETITWQFLKFMKDINFPEARGIHVEFKIDVEHEDVKEKLDAYQAAYQMGAAIKESDVMELIGAAMPGPEDRVLKQQEQQPGMPGMSGGVAPGVGMKPEHFEAAFAKGKAGGNGERPGGAGGAGGDSPTGGGPVNPGDNGERTPADQYANTRWQLQHRGPDGRWAGGDDGESDGDEPEVNLPGSLEEIGEQIRDTLEDIGYGGPDVDEKRLLLRKLMNRAAELADVAKPDHDTGNPEQYARRAKLKPSSHQKQLIGDQQQELHWITLHGGEHGHGEGSVHVQVDGHGNIHAGPAALAEKGITKLSDFGKKEKPAGAKDVVPLKAAKPSRKVGGEHQPGLFEPDAELHGQKLLGLGDEKTAEKPPADPEKKPVDMEAHRERLRELARKYDEAKAKNATVTDVTPDGYGPGGDDAGEDTIEDTSEASGGSPAEKPATFERQFLTAGEAAKKGMSHAQWTGDISEAFVNGEIGEDHPAWQSIQHGNSANIVDYNDARDIFGKHVRTERGDVGKVVDISDDARTVTVEHPDGSKTKHTSIMLDDLGAWAKHRIEQGKTLPDNVTEYLADKLSDEAIANGENISKPMERMGIPVVKGKEIRNAIAEKLTEKKDAMAEKEKAADEPSEARQRAMEKQKAAQAEENESDGRPSDAWSPETHTTIAADSIEQLRQQDVYRLLESAPPQFRQSMANYIRKNRPEFSQEIHDSMLDLDGTAADATAPPAASDENPTEGAVAEADGGAANGGVESTTVDRDASESPNSPASLFDDAIDSGDDPREAAEKAAKHDPDYEFARKSAVGNVGEDLKGSARHKVNAWRSLAEAEADGTAEAMVTRDNLLKAEPHTLMEHVEKNPRTALAMHWALKSFPAKPGYGNDKALARRSPEEAKKDRQQYLDAYRLMKSKAEELAATESDPNKAIDKLHTVMTEHLRDLRTQPLPGRPEGSLAKDIYNNTANSLVKTTKRIHPRMRGGVASALTEFNGKLTVKYYGQVSEQEKEAAVAKHASDLIEGRSMPATFGEKSEGRGKTFDPAAFYGARPERIGGPSLGDAVSTPQKAAKTMVDKFGLRGVQWGSSVTDSEREHHAKMSAEALADLADILKLSPQTISLGGKLGLAIGARGHGNALAHYEPGTQVINLTRMNGVGSLAHEWGHGFDNFISDFKGFATETASRRSDDPVQKALIGLRDKMHASGYQKRLDAVLDRMVQNKQMSREKANKYWDSHLEKFARAFERHVQHKLESVGRKNSYLAGIESKAWKSEADGLWPNDAEVKSMAPDFDHLFAAYNEKFPSKEKYSRAELVRYFRQQQAAANPLVSAFEAAFTAKG